MRSKGWMFILALTLLLGACGGAGETVELVEIYASVESTDLGAESGGLPGWGVTEQEVREQRGKPIMEGVSSNKESLLNYGDYEYIFDGDKLQGYMLQQGAKTEEGLGIGDSREAIVRHYGPNFVEREHDKRSLLGYMDKANKRVMEFVMKEGQAESVYVLSVD